MIVDVKDRTKKSMACMVACSCRKVAGRARLHISESMEPILVYEVQGEFHPNRHDNLLYCPECCTSVMTVGEWILE
jgi:hypothetical protein